MPSVAYRLPYWQNGDSALKEAVTLFTDYLDALKLSTGSVSTPAPTSDQLVLIKRYITVWMDYDGWKIKKDDEADFLALKLNIPTLGDLPAIKNWLQSALYFGIDPF